KQRTNEKIRKKKNECIAKAMQKQFFQPKIIKKQVFRRIITKNYPTQHVFQRIFLKETFLYEQSFLL
ncbi:MAG: hypothetical protein ABIC91_04920, partial [Nanoarchaeota archaeon]|nr:hypothetical protein [Nanoarchaeota archaeon]